MTEVPGDERASVYRCSLHTIHTVNKALDIMHEEFPNLAALGLLNDVISIDELIARLKFKLNELEKKASMENSQKKSACRRHR